MRLLRLPKCHSSSPTTRLIYRHGAVRMQRLVEDRDNCDAIAVALGDKLPCERRIDWIITRGMTIHGGGMIPRGVSDHPCFWVDMSPASDATERFARR